MLVCPTERTLQDVADLSRVATLQLDGLEYASLRPSTAAVLVVVGDAVVVDDAAANQWWGAEGRPGLAFLWMIDRLMRWDGDPGLGAAEARGY